MLKIDGTIVATGCFVDNHITRVYVLPKHQKKGYGTFIMKNAKKQGVSQIALEATAMGRPLYERYGFMKMKDEMELKE